MNPPEDASIPSRIGPYKVLELLGQGGMGEVYLAEQSAPVMRQVAVKVSRPGMDTKAVLARFEAERQALAIMAHPSIATVLDAGTTEDGRPYFVMEYVDGVPLTDYCDRQRLRTDERLRLFIELCGAVQHAHQKGVIHRDLKPSNVLVTVPNGQPVPTVIDFGIAKAMGYKLTELTLHTQQGYPIGTPAYMSPEQAEMTGLDVDTRTDVYTLGVMLYELLVGTVPIDMRDIPPTALSIALRETDPPKPSDRFDTLGDYQDRIAELRHTDPGSLRSQVRGDLDWIVMKAMEKDRTRRYETVNGLAQDIRRHLKHEPVLAAAPSAGYRMRKFARRHRLGVVAGAAIAVGLIGGSVLALMGMVRAQRAERVAEAEADAAREAYDFLEGLFQVSDPGEARGNTITAREILDEGAEQIRTELGGQPLTQARFMSSIGTVYRKLGLYEAAAPLLEEALALQDSVLEPDHPDVARSLNELGVLYSQLGRYADAEPIYRRALAIDEQVFGLDDTKVAVRLANLSDLCRELGRYEEAEALLQRALAIDEKAKGPDHPDVATDLNNLAVLYRELGRYEEAEPLYLRALAIDERELGPDHPALANRLANLAALYRYLERYEEAIPLLERALAIDEKALGPDSPDMAITLNTLAVVYRELERYAEAEALFMRALAIHEGVLGPNHLAVGAGLNNLGVLYHKQGRYEEAEPLLQRALTTVEQALGPEHVNVSLVLANLANVYREQGRHAEAEPLFQRALNIRDTAVGPDHPATAGILDNYASLLHQTGRTELADSLDARAAAIRTSQAPDG
jgi:non-specific serine/threonine protein kinase/serine/threonine-protein kinase